MHAQVALNKTGNVAQDRTTTMKATYIIISVTQYSIGLFLLAFFGAITNLP